MRLRGAFAEACEEFDLAVRRYLLAGASPAAGLAHAERGDVRRILGDVAGAERAASTPPPMVMNHSRSLPCCGWYVAGRPLRSTPSGAARRGPGPGEPVLRAACGDRHLHRQRSGRRGGRPCRRARDHRRGLRGTGAAGPRRRRRSAAVGRRRPDRCPPCMAQGRQDMERRRRALRGRQGIAHSGGRSGRWATSNQRSPSSLPPSTASTPSAPARLPARQQAKQPRRHRAG